MEWGYFDSFNLRVPFPLDFCIAYKTATGNNGYLEPLTCTGQKLTNSVNIPV